LELDSSVKALGSAPALDLQVQLLQYNLENAIMAIINDTLGNSNPSLSGTNELDIINAFDGDDTVYGRGGNDFIFGGSGDDRIYGDFPKEQAGGNDYIDGGLGNDTLVGGVGDDRLVDLFGSNYLYGDEGNDTLIAGFGNDSLIGGDGTDRLTGGLGRDLFHLDRTSVDTITDFNPNDDVMVLPIEQIKDFASVANDSLLEINENPVVYSRGSGDLYLNLNGSDPGFGEKGGKIGTLLGTPQLSLANVLPIPK
jgi:Ca2+-binding RTX toxin-like protein